MSSLIAGLSSKEYVLEQVKQSAVLIKQEARWKKKARAPALLQRANNISQGPVIVSITSIKSPT